LEKLFPSKIPSITQVLWLFQTHFQCKGISVTFGGHLLLWVDD
jgi:hypothetical protein